MDLTLMVILAVVSVLTALIACLRVIPWKVLMRFHWFADIAFTLLLIWMFSGTLQGMVIAVIAGLVFSVVLSVGKAFTPKETKHGPAA